MASLRIETEPVLLKMSMAAVCLNDEFALDRSVQTAGFPRPLSSLFLEVFQSPKKGMQCA